MKKFTPHSQLVTDRNGDILWEHQIPMMKESLGISQRAELARRAMATPIDHSPCHSPALPNVRNKIAAIPWWAKWIYIGSALLVLSGIGMLVWA